MPSPLAPIPFTASFVDGHSESLLIKPLSITDLYKWLYLAKDQGEPAMVAHCLGKDLQWVDSLEIDSFANLAQKCFELNFQLAVRIGKSAPVAAALLAPVIQRQGLALRTMAILLAGSGVPSTGQPPSASATETPSESPTPTPSKPSAAS